MAAIQETATESTLVELVDWLVEKVGDKPSGSVEDGRTITSSAVAAANDALSEVWSRYQWPFRLDGTVLTLELDKMWYDLPSTFAEVAFEVPRYLGYRQLDYKDFKELLRENPWFQWFPSASMNLSVYQNVALDNRHYGTPRCFTIAYNDPVDQMGVFPAPNERFFEALEKDTSDTLALPFPFFRSAPVLVAGSDVIRVPRNLWSAHKYLALAYLKEAREFADYQADEARAERYIQREMNRVFRRGRARYRFRPDGHR